MVVIICNLHWWCFSYANLPIYWCAQAHMGVHCNLHCVVVFVVCDGGGGSVYNMCVCACMRVWMRVWMCMCMWVWVWVCVGRCVCVQCVCGVGVVYCASVYVFVHGANKQPRKRKKWQKVNGEKDDSVPMNGFEPTSSCLWINCAKSSVTGFVLIGVNVLPLPFCLNTPSAP